MLPTIVRRAIHDRILPRSLRMKSGSASVSVVVRLTVDPSRIRNIGGRERQLNLTDREMTCLQPFQVTFFSNHDTRRRTRLIINRRRAYFLSITNSGIVVFSYSKIW